MQLLLEHVMKVVPWEFFPFTQCDCSPFFFFYLLLTELLHFISLEMTEAFASSDADKKGFIIYNKPTRCNSGSIVFINNYKYALHVSDALCVHHQEHYNYKTCRAYL